LANLDLIKKLLPEALRESAQQFVIADQFLQTLPDLIVLVLNSKSMDTKEEKQSWFNLLPLMNQEQITKLRDILTREKQKLEEIEKKYEQKKDDIKAKYVQKWEQVGYQERMNQIKETEAANQQKEDVEAERLLTNI
jgi:hypothetical protein